MNSAAAAIGVWEASSPPHLRVVWVAKPFGFLHFRIYLMWAFVQPTKRPILRGPIQASRPWKLGRNFSVWSKRAGEESVAIPPRIYLPHMASSVLLTPNGFDHGGDEVDSDGGARALQNPRPPPRRRLLLL